VCHAARRNADAPTGVDHALEPVAQRPLTCFETVRLQDLNTVKNLLHLDISVSGGRAVIN
jgi:hypothetical protein